ncbi:hypothetical protein TIFTF001_007171 [Ficus carica]|uniref:Uncharacterized protein n=1 Tax=Ficus carica TaxID=3494 RepID=A0AA88CWS9_FICCA|nr:hypothetical protein TIFTF001_007171 [Ficus carica]
MLYGARDRILTATKLESLSSLEWQERQRGRGVFPWSAAKPTELGETKSAQETMPTDPHN